MKRAFSPSYDVRYNYNYPGMTALVDHIYYNGFVYHSKIFNKNKFKILDSLNLTNDELANIKRQQEPNYIFDFGIFPNIVHVDDPAYSVFNRLKFVEDYDKPLDPYYIDQRANIIYVVEKFYTACAARQNKFEEKIALSSLFSSANKISKKNADQNPADNIMPLDNKLLEKFGIKIVNDKDVQLIDVTGAMPTINYKQIAAIFGLPPLSLKTINMFQALIENSNANMDYILKKCNFNVKPDDTNYLKALKIDAIALKNEEDRDSILTIIEETPRGEQEDMDN